MQSAERYKLNDLKSQTRVRISKLEAQKRLLIASARMFKALHDSVSDTPLECPITLEPISKEHFTILPCCTNVFDGRFKHMLNKNCPMCGQQLDGLLNASSAISALQSAAEEDSQTKLGGKKRSINGSSANTNARSNLASTTPPVSYEAMMQNLKAQQTKGHSGSMSAVAHVVKAFLQFKPSGARIIVAFSIQSLLSNDEIVVASRTVSAIKTRLAGYVDAVNAINNTRCPCVKEYVQDDDTNRILLVNTTSYGTNSSLVGLNLGNTDLIVMVHTRVHAHYHYHHL